MSMRSGRQALDNGLAKQLTATPDMSLGDVLCHSDLSTAIRSESRPFLDYLSTPDPNRPDGQVRLLTLLEWALSPQWNTRELDDHWRQCQLNRNASNVLSHPRPS
jgi:hypothetical protein